MLYSIIILLLFSAYSFITNLIAAYIIDTHGINSFDSISYMSISLSSKFLNPTDLKNFYYVIQAWLGVALVTVLGISFIAIKYFQKGK